MHKWQNSIMNKNINKRVAELRLHLRKNGLAAYIFPSTDPHHSEYPPEYWKTREWISGFNGSAGTAVVTSDDAALWTDSRYFIAAEEQLKDTPFRLMKERLEGTPSVTQWLAEVLPPGSAWTSINVVNCTDGVDGLSASLAVVSIGTFLLAYGEELGDYSTAAIVFIGALLAYLWSNAKPSSLLMGDAGSRAMGFFLAILALKSGHPFAFLLAALVFIVDGSLGILKISFKRFLHISILKNTLTPLHDHVRKRMGWSDEQVVARWLILQAVASALLLLMTR